MKASFFFQNYRVLCRKKVAFAVKYGMHLPCLLVTIEWKKHCNLQGLFLRFFQVEALSVMGAWLTDEILYPFLFLLF